jgi:cell division topological specificity factor
MLSNPITRVVQYFRRPKKTSQIAKERLQIIIAHERARGPDYLESLKEELLAVISKYVKINKNAIKVDLERKEGCSILELNVTLPDGQQEYNS